MEAYFNFKANNNIVKYALEPKKLFMLFITIRSCDVTLFREEKAD